MRRQPRSLALHARRKAMRTELDRRKQAARAALREKMARARRPRQGQAQGRRRRWWLLVLLVLLLLLLLRDCRCTEPPVGPGPGPAAPPAPGPAALPAPPPPPPVTDRIPKAARPAYEGRDPAPLPWLDAFRLQVGARAPRLATCFEGAADPGALKWSAAVEPLEGRVSEQTLEPLTATDSLTREQRDCALGVLSDPPYDLDAAGARTPPTRVSMVIEF